MDELEINRLLFVTIDNIKKIGSPKVSTWAPDNKYVQPPCFRFYFKDTVDTDTIYSNMRDIIIQYKGLLEWEMLHDKSKSRSFFILPKQFAPFLFKGGFHFNKDRVISDFPKEEYVSVVDKAILDIPMLAKFIEENWNKK